MDIFRHLLIYFSLELCMLLAGRACSLPPEPASYDFAVYDQNKQIYLYACPEDEAEPPCLLDTLERAGEDFYYWGAPFSWEAGGKYFTKTSVSDRDQKVSLVEIDPEYPANPIYKKLAEDSIDIYSFTADKHGVYTIDVYTDRLIFKKYDTQLRFLKKAEIDNRGRSIAANQLLSIGDKLYLLVGIVDRQKGNGEIISEIWTLDRDFNILKTYSLPEAEGFLLRMVHDGQRFYVSSPIADSHVSDGRPSCCLYVYQEDEKQGSMDLVQKLTLTKPYPKEMAFDEKNKLLLIYHDSYRTANLCWTVINPETGEEQLLDFPEYVLGSEKAPRDPFFTVHAGKYYFLFSDHLETYDPVEKVTGKYPYQKQKVQEPYFIIFRR